MSLLRFLGGYDSNPGMSAANKLYDKARTWEDPNNQFYKTMGNNVYRNMSRTLNENVGFNSMMENQANAMGGMRDNGLLGRINRQKNLVTAQDKASNAATDYMANITGEGMKIGSNLYSQGANTEFEGTKYEADTKNSFVNNLISTGIGLATSGGLGGLIGNIGQGIGNIFKGGNVGETFNAFFQGEGLPPTPEIPALDKIQGDPLAKTKYQDSNFSGAPRYNMELFDKYSHPGYRDIFKYWHNYYNGGN